MTEESLARHDEVATTRKINDIIKIHPAKSMTNVPTCPQSEAQHVNKMESYCARPGECSESGQLRPCLDVEEDTTSKIERVSCVCSAVSAIDPSGVNTLPVEDASDCRLRPCRHTQQHSKTSFGKISCALVATHHTDSVESDVMQLEGARDCRLKSCCHHNARFTTTTTNWGGRISLPEKKLYKLTLFSAHKIQLILEEELLREETRTSILHSKRGFVRAHSQNDSAFSIDKMACKSLSNIIRKENMSLEEATRFVRGETEVDGRPNKALNPERLRLVLEGYPHLELLTQFAEKGIDVEWRHGPVPQRPPPKNHGSCHRYLRAVTRSIRERQNSGQYMVVDANILDQWSEVVCSPLGAVAKKDADPHEEVRTIHDLSFPKNNSVNSTFVVESVPKVRYESVITIARRIEQLAADGHVGRIFMLKGDVKGAFRHLRTCCTQVFRMAAFVKELEILIIDMAAPFGWSGSPPCYALFGGAISWLMGSNSPSSVSTSADQNPFFPYEWMDDHILVEPDIEDRLHLAEATLRHAMLAVLGPCSINEAKFSSWSSELVALGLLWNISRRTVSIPTEKLTKASNRASEMLKQGRASKTEFYKILGSLRHVAICLRTAKPFYQRLQSQCTAVPRFGKVQLSEGAKEDLQWFRQILKHGNLAELPLSMFGDTVKSDVELYMDASNVGLAILDPSSNKFIQIQFDENELNMISRSAQNDTEFSINVREHLCIALALWTWGAQWNRQSSGRLVHIKCWSDNTAAVNWCNKLHSKNPFSQDINRCIGLAEGFFNLRVSAGHIPGSSNWMADAASRASTEPHLTRWTNFASCWSQTEVPHRCRKIYTNFSSRFRPNHWPRLQSHNITAHGTSGANGGSGFSK